MAQAFPQSTVLLIKLALLGMLVLVLALGAALKWRMAPQGALQEPLAQPIQFSHKHHVGDDGIDCRYCHTAVEKSSFAGLPSTRICLTCHSQLFHDSPQLAPLFESEREGKPIRWNRVHDLPDFVYFDHSIHINKGVPCLACHGRVDQMPLTRRVASLDMQWCLHCHRSAPDHVRPPAQIFSMENMAPLSADEVRQIVRMYQLQDARRLTDCSTCHR